MPELPDVVVYIERLRAFTEGRVLERVRLVSPFLVRTYEPPLSAAHGRRVEGYDRIGKRIVMGLEGDLFVVMHLMIAGRLRWKEPGAVVQKKVGLCAFDFEHGTLSWTEASSKKRASLFLVRGRDGLADFVRGGVEPLECTTARFAEAITAENRTLKRALTDPRIVSGVGNAYSDEILFRARLSPVKRTAQLTMEEIERLLEATRETLVEWTDRLRAEVAEEFPDKVTAFREQMSVHGKYRQPCPVCATPVQRIRHASNEVNYCAKCQTGGKVLADRSLSRLLRKDWPKNVEELEELELKRAPKEETSR